MIKVASIQQATRDEVPDRHGVEHLGRTVVNTRHGTSLFLMLQSARSSCIYRKTSMISQLVDERYQLWLLIVRMMSLRHCKEPRCIHSIDEALINANRDALNTTSTCLASHPDVAGYHSTKAEKSKFTTLGGALALHCPWRIGIVAPSMASLFLLPMQS
jgi:hypothetical protein